MDKNVGIQYLRAICALVVYFSHYVMAINNPVINAFRLTRWSFIVDGSIAVCIFFVLSGFFYYNNRGFEIGKYLKGVKRKTFRIYPAHIIMLLLGWMLAECRFDWDVTSFTEWGNMFWVGDITFSNFLNSASCLLIKLANEKINPSMWYLEYEVWLFLIMPFIVGFINRIGWKWSWGLLVLGIVALFADLRMYHLLYVVAVCCMGVLARYLCHLYEFKFLENKKYLTLWIFMAILLIVHNYFGAGNMFMFFRGIGSAMLVIVFWKCHFASTKLYFLEFLGCISFEFYVVQHISLLAFRPCFVNPIVYLILTLTITIVVAWLLNRYVTLKW